MPITVGPVHIEVFPERIMQRGGSVDLATQVKAQQVHELAKDFIGTRYGGHHPGQPRMKDTGSVLPGEGLGVSWRVVFNHPFAIGHHEGSSAHTMPKKTSGFYARRGPGGYSFGPTRGPISHPGHSGNPYLVKAAQAAGLTTTSGDLRTGRLRGTGGRFIPFPSSI